MRRREPLLVQLAFAVGLETFQMRLNLLDQSLVGSAISDEESLDQLLVSGSDEEVWLVLCLLLGRTTSPERLRSFRRDAVLHGGLSSMLALARKTRSRFRRRPLPKVVTGAAQLVLDSPAGRFGDIGATAATHMIFAAEHGELARLDFSPRSRGWTSAGHPVVPWECRSLVVVGITTDSQQLSSLTSIARFSRSAVVGVGYGTGPLVSRAERATDPAFYASWLGALQHFAAIAAIDHQSAEDMRGWASMLPGIGRIKPRIVEVLPPADDEPAAWSNYVTELANLGH